MLPVVRTIVRVVKIGKLTLIGFFIPVSFVFASDVVLNEFQVEPSTLQWVELYNTGSSAVDISGWIIDDNGSPSTKYTISDNTVLPSHMCFVISSGNFNFNTSSADSARLLQGETVVDSYAYQKSPGANISFFRLPDGIGEWATGSASFGSFNSGGDPCLPPATPTPTPTVTPTSVPTSAPTNTPQPTNTTNPTATAAPTKTPTPKPTATKISTPTKEEAFAILGESSASSQGAQASDDVPTQTRSVVSPWVFALLFIGVGLGILAFALAWKKHIELS